MKSIVILSLLLFACDRDSGVKKSPEPDATGYYLAAEQGFYVRAEWKEPLQAGGEGTNEVTLHFLNKEKKIPAKVELMEFHPRMPQMGHGTDESTQKLETDDLNKDKVIMKGIYFNMSGKEGEWVVTIRARIDDIEDTLKISVPEVK